jgi:hypothetical protein
MRLRARSSLPGLEGRRALAERGPQFHVQARLISLPNFSVKIISALLFSYFTIYYPNFVNTLQKNKPPGFFPLGLSKNHSHNAAVAGKTGAFSEFMFVM